MSMFMLCPCPCCVRVVSMLCPCCVHVVSMLCPCCIHVYVVSMSMLCPCLCCVHVHAVSRFMLCPCPCCVHVHVVIHFCDSMMSFWMEANLCRFILYRFVYKCIFERYPIIKRGGRWDPIHRLNTATLLCLSQARHSISNTIRRCLFVFN